MSLNLTKLDLTSEPPSVSNVSEKTSVLTTSFSRFAGVKVTPRPNGKLATGAVAAGTDDVLGVGTDVALALGITGAVATALTGVDLGKNVACLPLNACH